MTVLQQTVALSAACVASVLIGLWPLAIGLIVGQGVDWLMSMETYGNAKKGSETSRRVEEDGYHQDWSKHVQTLRGRAEGGSAWRAYRLRAHAHEEKDSETQPKELSV